MTGALLGATTAVAGHASLVDWGTFVVAAAIVLAGAVGVVVARNPVHSALMLVMTLFGIAVLFVLQRADFLAAVQVIVYAGAIVVLFLFVIMFLGVDREEQFGTERLRGQRPLAIGLVLLGATGLLLLGEVSKWVTGAPSVAGSTDVSTSNVAQLGTSVYTTYLFPFEVTSALLVIAVVGAVVLARRPPVAANQPGPAPGDAVSTPGDGDSGDRPVDPDVTGGDRGVPDGPGAASAPPTGVAPPSDPGARDQVAP
jgi:NADH-quinone oxidoreductase subunit J